MEKEQKNWQDHVARVGFRGAVFTSSPEFRSQARINTMAGEEPEVTMNVPERAEAIAFQGVLALGKVVMAFIPVFRGAGLRGVYGSDPLRVLGEGLRPPPLLVSQYGRDGRQFPVFREDGKSVDRTKV